MKLTIERASLLSSLAHVQSVVERRNTIPILANVLLEAKTGILGLTATDMDLEIVERAPAEVGQEGATTAPAHTFYDIVRKLPEGSQVRLESNRERSQLLIKCGRSQFTLQTLPGEDFPVMTGGELPTQFSLPAAELKMLVDRTSFAISTEETRYYLNGIYIHAAEAGKVKFLRAAATDGHRLARIEMALPAGAEGMPGVILPRKTVIEMRKLIDTSEAPVQVALSETRVRFGFDDIVLTSKLIDGTFPDYERVIPHNNDKILEVARSDFTEAVDRVSTISTEKSRAVKLAIADGALTLSASSPEAGSATEELEVKYNAGALEIGFNSRYLLDITKQIEGEGVRFAMSDAASPTVVQDVADTSALYVLMPMRV